MSHIQPHQQLAAFGYSTGQQGQQFSDQHQITEQQLVDAENADLAAIQESYGNYAPSSATYQTDPAGAVTADGLTADQFSQLTDHRNSLVVPTGYEYYQTAVKTEVELGAARPAELGYGTGGQLGPVDASLQDRDLNASGGHYGQSDLLLSAHAPAQYPLAQAQAADVFQVQQQMQQQAQQNQLYSLTTQHQFQQPLSSTPIQYSAGMTTPMGYGPGGAVPVVGPGIQNGHFSHFAGPMAGMNANGLTASHMGFSTISPGFMPTHFVHPMAESKNLLDSFQANSNGRHYMLTCRQQPVRARMCGFGDKDRRPITPPPCIHLRVIDLATGLDIPATELHPTYYVITADLWTVDGAKEVSLVKHNYAAQISSISTTTPASFPPKTDAMIGFISSPTTPEGNISQQFPPGTAPPGMIPVSASGQTYSVDPQTQTVMIESDQQLSTGQLVGGSGPPSSLPLHQAPPSQFTRNLIGSLTVNGFVLKDDNKEAGLWFIFQDLSVRTEGTFRLRFNFIDVGGDDGNSLMRSTKAPVLATVFSAPFQVYSAKKFPGVIESTPLSKVFANQGIKIPIRKDGMKDRDKGDFDD